MVKIKQQLVTRRTETFNGTNPAKTITVHQTGNFAKGTGAQVHANLQTNGFTASWHWTVDDKVAIQSYPHTVRCWHAGDGRGKGNYESIGVEICVNSDIDYVKALENAAKLIQKIMKDENIPLSNVKQHNFFSGKPCPSEIRKGRDGITWDKFIKMVEGKTSKPSKPVSKPAPSKPKPSIKPVSKPTGVYKGNSIVDYLNFNKINSSFANRKKLAAQHGINNYRGTAAENTNLLAKLRGGKPTVSKPKTKSISLMATEVIQGKHNNGHANRRKSLGVNQATYNKVRAEVNKRL